MMEYRRKCMEYQNNQEMINTNTEMNMNMSKSKSMFDICSMCNIYHTCFYRICCVCHNKMVYLWRMKGKNMPLKCYRCLEREGGVFSRNSEICVRMSDKIYLGFDGYFHSDHEIYEMVTYRSVVSPVYYAIPNHYVSSILYSLY